MKTKPHGNEKMLLPVNYYSWLTPPKDSKFYKIVPVSASPLSQEPNIQKIPSKFPKLQVVHAF